MSDRMDVVKQINRLSDKEKNLLKYSAICLVWSCLLLVSCGKKDSQTEENEPTKRPINENVSKQNQPIVQPNASGTEEQKRECLQNWKSWGDKYAAASPIAANLKTDTASWTVSIDQTFVQKILDGKAEIVLPNPKNSSEMVKIDFFSKDLDSWYKIEPRDKNILNNIEKIVQNSNADELVIVFAGGAHALDYFFNHIDSDIYYASYPVNESTVFESNEVYDLNNLLGKSVAREHYNPMVRMGLIKRMIYYKKMGMKLDVDRLMDASFPNSNKVFIQDIHGVNESELTDHLPVSPCLQPLGFKRVKVVIEGMPLGQTSLQAIRNHLDLGKNFSDADRAKIRQISVDAYDLLQSGTVTSLPELFALLKKLKTYENDGIEVQYFGIE